MSLSNNDAASFQKQMEHSYAREMYNRLDEFMKPFIINQISIQLILHMNFIAELLLLPTVVPHSSGG
jgi:hypothetical protein